MINLRPIKRWRSGEKKFPWVSIYKKERPTFEQLQGVLQKEPLITQKPDPSLVEPLLEEFL